MSLLDRLRLKSSVPRVPDSLYDAVLRKVDVEAKTLETNLRRIKTEKGWDDE